MYGVGVICKASSDPLAILILLSCFTSWLHFLPIFKHYVFLEFLIIFELIMLSINAVLSNNEIVMSVSGFV